MFRALLLRRPVFSNICWVPFGTKQHGRTLLGISLTTLGEVSRSLSRFSRAKITTTTKKNLLKTAYKYVPRIRPLLSNFVFVLISNNNPRAAASKSTGGGGGSDGGFSCADKERCSASYCPLYIHIISVNHVAESFKPLLYSWHVFSCGTIVLLWATFFLLLSERQ